MIVYDLRPAIAHPHPERGIPRYTLDLASSLARRPSCIDLFLVPELGQPPKFASDRSITETELVRRAEEIELFHVTSPFEPQTPDRLSFGGRQSRMVVTLFDLIPFVFPDRYLGGIGTRAKQWARSLILYNADKLLAISKSASADATRLLGIEETSITVIGAGVAPIFLPSADRRLTNIEVRRILRRDVDRFVLVPAAHDWRKNLDGAVTAFAQLPEAVRRATPLVIVCALSDEGRTWLGGLANDLAISDEVILTGFIPDVDLVSLYQAATLVVFPSRYEGFGLPVLEARSCGAPVVCGDNSSLVEVHPDARWRFDADDVGALTRLMRSLLEDPDLLREAAQAPVPGYSWELAAATTHSVYRSLVANGN